MILLDANVLIDANRVDAGAHLTVSGWLVEVLASGEPVGLPDETLVGFLRVVTNHRIYRRPTSPADALAFCDALTGTPTATRVSPGRNHWQTFTGLVREHHLKGNDIPDAHLAALALERGATLATRDRGFARFAGLRVRHPGSGR